MPAPIARRDLMVTAAAGAAVGLGVLFAPLALLPTIQLGVGENSQCERLTEAGRAGREGRGAR